MSRWFRWYEGTSEDGKFRVVARLSRVTVRDVIALWAFMLEDAAHLDHRGICERNEDFMSSILDFDDGVVENVLAAMETAGMISVGHGAITICNWGKRQFESDADPTAAERQARKRQRDKAMSNEPVTRDSRSPDTEDREQNTERKKESCAVANATRTERDEVFEEFWKAYPKRQGANPKSPALKVFRGFVKSGVDPQAIVAGARHCAAADSKKIGTEFIPQAVKWLRDRRWEDYAAAAVATDTEPIWKKPPPEYLARIAQEKANGAKIGTETGRCAGVVKNGADHPEEFRLSGGTPLRSEEPGKERGPPYDQKGNA